ncbi:MAG: NAD(P)H-hydrate epimerase, partial [Gemmatimonadetes bacterium]|nr:NAD(P)H-hydrate epimerase [Gemmatimonadota bacterium]
MSPIAVVDAKRASAIDAAAIAAGIPSRALMQRAGAAAAAELVRQFPERIAQGVVVATGAGHNGGDGGVVAHALHAVGVAVRVVECVAARTPDCRAERDAAVAAGVFTSRTIDDLKTGGERIAVDALLGTGLTAGAALHDGVAQAVAGLKQLHARGVALVSLDLPTGLDANGGGDVGGLRCELTLTFGTIKRGHLVARGQCGRIVVLDIGLGAHATSGNDAQLVTPAWFRAALPAIAAEAHKGTRGKIAIVGGAKGMAGAAMLAARGALRSGAGMVKCVVAPESVAAIQEGEPAALAAPWPVNDSELDTSIVRWADAVLLGPGLGKDARAIVDRVLRAFDGPVVIDADALNAFAGDVGALRVALRGRPALLTPHPMEFARLSELGIDAVLEQRFTAPTSLAHESGTAVLLK